MAYSHNAPFRADVVGSYLRPAELKAAREDFAAGKIDAAALKAVEDKAITELVAKQKAAGLHVITDGEFRRGWWHFDFMCGLNGVDHAAAAQPVQSGQPRPGLPPLDAPGPAQRYADAAL